MSGSSKHKDAFFDAMAESATNKILSDFDPMIQLLDAQPPEVWGRPNSKKRKKFMRDIGLYDAILEFAAKNCPSHVERIKKVLDE